MKEFNPSVEQKESDFRTHNVAALELAFKEYRDMTTAFKVVSEHEYLRKLQIWLLVQRENGTIVEVSFDPRGQGEPSQFTTALFLEGTLAQRLDKQGRVEMEEMHLQPIPADAELSPDARRRLAASLAQWQEQHTVYIGHPQT